MTTGKTIALTRQTFVGKVMSLLFNMLSRLVITFLPRSRKTQKKKKKYSPFALGQCFSNFRACKNHLEGLLNRSLPPHPKILIERE